MLRIFRFERDFPELGFEVGPQLSYVANVYILFDDVRESCQRTVVMALSREAKARQISTKRLDVSPLSSGEMMTLKCFGECRA